MDEAAVSLPGRDMIDVKCHENWYQEYTTLLQRKKDGIQKWRLVKEVSIRPGLHTIRVHGHLSF